MKQTTALTLIAATENGEATGYYRVMRRDVFLAVITFDGPRGTIVTHQGSLRADERKELYRLQAAGTHLPQPATECEHGYAYGCKACDPDGV